MISILNIDCQPIQSNILTSIESSGSLICYNNFLFREIIKLASIFDDGGYGLSHSNNINLKPHLILGPNKHNLSFQVFNSSLYTASSIWPLLTKSFDTTSLESGIETQNKPGYSIIDYIIEGLKHGREVASNRRVLNTELVLYVISIDDFVTRRIDQILVNKYASELGKTKSGSMYISNKYISSITINIISCSMVSETSNADYRNQVDVMSIDDSAGKLNDLKRMLTSNTISNVKVNISSLFATSVHFEESFRNIRSELFSSQTCSLVFSQNNGLRCEINIQLYPMSLHSLKYQHDLNQLEVVCTIHSQHINSCFIEGSSFTCKSLKHNDPDSSGNVKSHASYKHNSLSFQCFLKALADSNSIAIVSSYHKSDSSREVWALIPPSSSSVAPCDSSGQYGKSTLIRLQNRDTLLSPTILSPTLLSNEVATREDDPHASNTGSEVNIADEEADLESYFKELLTESSTFSENFNPLIYISNSLNSKLLSIVNKASQNQIQNSTSNSNANQQKAKPSSKQPPKPVSEKQTFTNDNTGRGIPVSTPRFALVNTTAAMSLSSSSSLSAAAATPRKLQRRMGSIPAADQIDITTRETRGRNRQPAKGLDFSDVT